MNAAKQKPSMAIIQVKNGWYLSQGGSRIVGVQKRQFGTLAEQREGGRVAVDRQRYTGRVGRRNFYVGGVCEAGSHFSVAFANYFGHLS